MEEELDKYKEEVHFYFKIEMKEWLLRIKEIVEGDFTPYEKEEIE